MIVADCCSEHVPLHPGGGGGGAATMTTSPILDQTGMIIVTFRVEIAVLVTLSMFRKENGKYGNF